MDEDQILELLNKVKKPPVLPEQEAQLPREEDILRLLGTPKSYSFMDEIRRPEKYTAKDLTKDEFYNPIKAYMVDRFGAHIDEYDREDVVESFLNNMRGFSGGNSVRSVAEIAYLNEYDEGSEQLARAGEAYKIYEGMEGVFSGETTVGEKASASWDFVRSAVFDPVNLIGLGVGKAFTSVGFKGGSQVAKMAAKKAATKKMNQLVASGVSKQAAEEAAKKYGQRFLSKANGVAQAKISKEIAKRQAIQEEVKGSLIKKLALPSVQKEAGIIAAVEATAAASTDYLYQDAMIRTSVQEDYDIYRTGLTAVAGLVFGGIGGAASGVTRFSNTPTNIPKLKTTREGAKLTDLSESIGKYLDELETKGPNPYIPPVGKWAEDVAEGHELSSQNTQFFVTMLLGNEELGMKGLAHILLEQGYVWKRRSADDRISNFVGDIIKQADPQDFKTFLKDFKEKTGITVTRIVNPETGKLKVVDLDQETFANTFKRKMSDTGTVLNAASQAAKLLRKDVKNVTVDDVAEYLISGATPDLPDITKTLNSGVLGDTVKRLIEKQLPNAQNNLIRLMVAHPSTTALNITGWAAASSMNSMTDISRAVLYSGKAGLQLLYSKASAKESLDVAKHLIKNQKVKMYNLLDPNTTYEDFLRYSMLRPEAVKELSRVLPGGVEDLKKLNDLFDQDLTKFDLYSSQGVDIIQRFAGVQAQDMWTKSIEFMTTLDKQLRRPVSEGGFNMSMKEFMELPDVHKKMLTQRYVQLEAQAVTSTLKTVFSKSYADAHVIGGVAKVIEEWRNLPVVGLLIPFGRFFNNTIGFMADNTVVIPLISRALHNTNVPTSEILARGAVASALVYTLTEREKEFIKLGLNWNEEVTPEGAVIDEKYEFPYSGLKAMARVIALKEMGEDVPEELATQLSDQFFAQLTRQLGDSATSLAEIWKSVVSDEGVEVSKAFGQLAAGIGGNYISAGTRFIDPLNQTAGILRGSDFAIPDRKQGVQGYNEMLRYVDQLVGAALGDIQEEKFIATQGVARSQATKTFSTTREDKLTYTERLLNQIGKPSWLVGMRTMSAKSDNRYNQIFFEIIEDKSKALLDSQVYQRSNLEKRKVLFAKDVLEPARDAVKEYMKSTVASFEDSSMYTRIELSKKFGEKKVRLIMEELGMDPSIDKISEDELVILQSVLEFREEWLRNN